jgi:hypothetical protein
MKSKTKVIIFYVITIGIILIVTAILLYTPKDDREIGFLFFSEQVKSFEIDDRGNINIITHSNDKLSYKLRDSELFLSDTVNLIQQQYEAGIIENYKIASSVDIPWWLSLLPYLIFIVIIAVIAVLIKIIKINIKNKPGGNI